MTGKSLGKGIEALIPDYREPEGEAPEIADLLIDQIKTNPHQPRSDFDSEGLNELAASIRENGIIQPVTVRKSEDGYDLIAGERRLRAVKMLNIRTIPAYVIPMEGEESFLQLALIENIQREDLNPIDEAMAYQELVEKFGFSHGEVADRVGKDRSTVANTLRLLSLPDNVREALKTGKLTPGHARPLLALKDKKQVLAVFRKILNESLSVRRVEEIVKKSFELREKDDAGKPAVRRKSPHIQSVEEDLMARLGTKVKLRQKGNGGEVIVEYYTPEDLDRLLELFRMIEL